MGRLERLSVNVIGRLGPNIPGTSEPDKETHFCLDSKSVRTRLIECDERDNAVAHVLEYELPHRSAPPALSVSPRRLPIINWRNVKDGQEFVVILSDRIALECSRTAKFRRSCQPQWRATPRPTRLASDLKARLQPRPTAPTEIDNTVLSPDSNDNAGETNLNNGTRLVLNRAFEQTVGGDATLRLTEGARNLGLTQILGTAPGQFRQANLISCFIASRSQYRGYEANHRPRDSNSY